VGYCYCAPVCRPFFPRSYRAWCVELLIG
jgi:hypothetical protein